VPDWTTLYEQHSPAVWRAAWRILRDPNSAADCVQETFLAVMTYAETESVREWETLLVSVAVRRALSQLKDRSRRRSSAGTEEIRSAAPSPEQSAAATELAERLREALTSLPDRQAEIFCLRTFQEMTYHEIAEQLGLDETNVGVLLHRARQNLGRQLKAHHPLAIPEKTHDPTR